MERWRPQALRHARVATIGEREARASTVVPESNAVAAPAAPQHRKVLKNTAILLVGQAATIPLTVLLNVVMARYLGAGDFGYLYLGTALATFGLLLVEWGQAGTLPALVVADYSRSGVLLGTGLTYRAVSAVIVFAAIALGCHLAGYDARFQIVFALCMLGWTIGTLSSAGQDVIRGYERTDVTAYAGFAQQLLNLIAVLPILWLGGGLIPTLAAQALTPTIVAVIVVRGLKQVGVGKLAFERETLRSLMRLGTPFFMLSLAIALQPNVDAVLLSKLATIEAVGWYAVARKLTGLLVAPAASLGTALYPTLARLKQEDPEAFRSTLSTSLTFAAGVVAPLALGCLLYPDIGVRLFNRGAFGPAEDDLRILSLFVMLVYFTMVMGIGLMAAGRQRAWAITQMLCVLVSVVVGPLLIPWFQTHRGNGGLGVCVTNVLSEVVMLVVGVWLSPRGLFGFKLIKRLLYVAMAAGAMAGVAYALRALNPFIAAPIATITYGATLWLSGGIDDAQRELIRNAIGRRFKRWA
jgi:O-antigen/teichoic acid export membrane protein